MSDRPSGCLLKVDMNQEISHQGRPTHVLESRSPESRHGSLYRYSVGMEVFEFLYERKMQSPSD
jgi:hypothetical protein